MSLQQVPDGFLKLSCIFSAISGTFDSCQRAVGPIGESTGDVLEIKGVNRTQVEEYWCSRATGFVHCVIPIRF